MPSQNDNSTRTAILLFARSEKTESALKPLASCSKRNLLLWKNLNDMVLKTIEKTKLPYFISNENNQVGSTFGEKITHSIKAIFTKGFEKVIVVGNDCIELNSQYLLRAQLDLQMNDLVIGSDYSGGAYLIGVTKSKFNADSFENIPWQTKSVLTALQSLYKTQAIAFLPCLNDCSNAFDLKIATHRLSFSAAYRRILLSFLPTKNVLSHFETLFVSYYYHPLNFNKGSPMNI